MATTPLQNECKSVDCLLLLCGMDREMELLNAELLVHGIDENGVLLYYAVGDVIFLTIDLIFIDLTEHIGPLISAVLDPSS